MILVIDQTDTDYSVEWTDDQGAPIVPTQVSFVVTVVGASATFLEWEWDDITGFDNIQGPAANGSTVDYDNDTITVHIDSEYPVPVGRYFYTLRGLTGSTWTLLDAGMLRSRWL